MGRDVRRMNWNSGLNLRGLQYFISLLDKGGAYLSLRVFGVFVYYACFRREELHLDGNPENYIVRHQKAVCRM